MASLPPGNDLSTTPAETPPPGITPNFVNPESHEPAAISIALLTLVLTVVLVLTRLFSNYHATRGLGWDDSIILDNGLC